MGLLHLLEIILQEIQHFAISRGSLSPPLHAPGHGRWFPGMLLSLTGLSVSGKVSHQTQKLPPSSSQLRWEYNRVPRGALCLVYDPAISRNVPAGACRIDQQRSEPLHPAIDGHVIDLDPAFGQQLLNITVGEPIPQVPTHCTKMTSDGKWKPAKPDFGAGTRAG